MRSAIVIGAGIGGLALAIRLSRPALPSTLSKHATVRAAAPMWERDGFTFDAGPTVITDPACLAELWRLTGADMAADVTLLPVSPFYRLQWPDGSHFDYGNDEPALRREIAAFNPADVAGYERFLRYSKTVHAEGYVKLGAVPFLDFASMLKAAPALARQRWRSVMRPSHRI